MNKELKKILSRYLTVCVVLTCLMCLMAGAVTAKQRSEYNSYFTPYAVMSLKSNNESITLSVDDKAYSFDFSSLKKLKPYRKYLYFTPFSCSIFFFESVLSIFSTFKG